MQVEYKTISTIEFDPLTQSYKSVDKEVEDISASFKSLLSLSSDEDSSEQGGLLNLTQSTQQTQPFNDFSSNLQAYRFRQNEAEVLKAQEASKMLNDDLSKEAKLGSLLSSIL